MFGWLVTNKEIVNSDYKWLPEGVEKKTLNGITFLRKHNGRFQNDVIFEETKEYFVIIDGVILNKNELVEEYNNTFLDIVIQLYQENKEKLPKSLRGSFSGMIYSKDCKEIFSFTNHTGDSGVFYEIEEGIIISSNFRWIAKLLKNMGAEYKLDKNAVNYMCTFGFMLDNTTFIDKIKRLMPGEYIHYSGKNARLSFYHEFNNYDTINMDEQVLIETIDQLFRQAIRREFEKDREYGYTSIVDLSGGLDCRMINYVAKEMGYADILNVSFSQTYSDEYKAMIELSRDLKFKLFHYPLDNATHLYDVDKIVAKNYGLSFYAGASALMSIMENINLQIYGLEHGGIMGDMADGVFPGSSYTEHIPPSFEKGMPFCRKFDLNILPTNILDEYKNLELFTIMGRGLLGGASTQLIRREYTGYASPFEDVDFYDFYLSIPVEVRGKQKILQKWGQQKYPDAFDVIEDKLMCKPNANAFLKKYKIIKRKIRGKLIQYVGNQLPSLVMNNMNPTEYWYNTNPQLRLFIEEYYEKNIHLLEEYEDSRAMVSALFVGGCIDEKLIALTILSTMKQFF